MKLFKYLAMVAAVAKVLEEAKGLLSLLAQDDYEGAAAVLLAWPALQEELEQLPAEAQAVVPMVLPVVLKALDRVVPEEQILGAMG